MSQPVSVARAELRGGAGARRAGKGVAVARAGCGECTGKVAAIWDCTGR